MASEITYAEVKFKDTVLPVEAKAPPEKSTSQREPCKPKLWVPWLVSALLLLLCVALIITLIVILHKDHKLPETFPEWHCALGTPGSKARTWTCCPVSWKRFQANCYYSASDSMSWDESEKNCTGMGSHLVVINTQAEQDFLLRWTKDIYSDRRGYFIGLSAQEVEAQWRWVDQTPYNQTAAFWRPGEPSSPETEKCTAFQVNSRVEPKQNWNDVSCSIPLNRICEAAAAFM
ncbi:PREDICTED: C-type lectin domain family 4 member A isoform X2 [Crocodylus porosus]|uniref:C-type lectin domain family 4 member A isoform X2 n=1 Tax=Crocodylus porosus TaxID=8502 RepID=UPI00093ED580|nr:PREDICTED: C-type lectin domain family 4 member A isoform X2 [Crocodylus porosus]